MLKTRFAKRITGGIVLFALGLPALLVGILDLMHKNEWGIYVVAQSVSCLIYGAERIYAAIQSRSWTLYLVKNMRRMTYSESEIRDFQLKSL